MPRFVFNSVQEYEQWLKDHRERARHTLYFSKLSVSAIPGVSTDPLLYGYFRGEEKDIKELWTFAEQQKYPKYRARTDWDTAKPIDARQR